MTSGALAIGLPGSVSAGRAAPSIDDPTQSAVQEDPNWRRARMYGDECHSVEEFSFDLEAGDVYDLADGGGEGAVRPRNLFTNALFRITSSPLGYVPDDVLQSGYFTDYVGVHAEYLGTSDRFLFFPQEEADFEEGGLYVMWDEFELFDPAGNLAAIEFNAVDEGTISVDDDFL